MSAHVVNQAATRTRRPTASADDPILAAKITAPSVPDWAVPRPRITKLIAEGTRWCPLTVLTGPPGAGKSMALALWAAAEPGTVAWVALDKFDNRPGVFWSYVMAALRRSSVAIPKALRVPERGRPGDEGFLLRFAAALAAQEPPVTLVLDDLHLLTEPRVLKGLDFVLRNVGPGLRLAVSSRMDPLLPLHRYRLSGDLTEIRASDLAFSTAEAGLLLTQHGSTLAPGLLENLTRRTEGWAAGLRLAAISLRAHPDPRQFVKELVAEDSALTGYLVDEVIKVQPPEVREVLLSTSILEHFSAAAAVQLAGDERAAGIITGLVRENAFIQAIGSGQYRYHTLFAEVLRLKLRHESPDRMAALHQQAARWYEKKGSLTQAVQHAVHASDWPLAAGLVIDGLAIGQIIERGNHGLAGEFASMPAGQAWTVAQPYLILAAMELSAGRHESSVSALNAAESLLEDLPADQKATCQLTATLICLTAALRSGDLKTATAAAVRAELMVNDLPSGKLGRETDIRARVLAGRGAVELWSGQLPEAARVLKAAVAAEAVAGKEEEQASYAGLLALVEALCGRLRRAAELAGQPVLVPDENRSSGWNPDPAALIALAWVHMERNDLREARSYLKQADDALRASPDKLIGAMAYLAAAKGALAEGRAAVAGQIIARARSASPVPAWLDRQLSLVESRACAAAGDIQSALAAAERAGHVNSLEAVVTLAHAMATAGDTDHARRALAPALGAESGTPYRVRLEAWLVDARLSYASGDRARGHQSLASALRLAEPEQLRLPFAVEQSWIGPVLQRDPELAAIHRSLLVPALRREQLPAPGTPAQTPVLVVEPLTEREREVLRHVSGMLNTAEVATEMFISVNTVKTHLKSIYRKLAAAHRAEAVRRARQLQLI